MLFFYSFWVSYVILLFLLGQLCYSFIPFGSVMLFFYSFWVSYVILLFLLSQLCYSFIPFESVMLFFYSFWVSYVILLFLLNQLCYSFIPFGSVMLFLYSFWVSFLYSLILFGLVSLFNAISTFVDYLMPKPFSYLTHSWEDMGVHTFPKGICPKVNVIARQEFELACFDFADHRFNHYTTRTPPIILWLIVSSLSPHRLHLIFSLVLSIFALI